MNPYRPLFVAPPPAAPAAAPRDVPATLAVLVAVSAVQLATAWHAHGVAAAQTLTGLTFLAGGLAGLARTTPRRLPWTTPSSSS